MVRSHALVHNIRRGRYELVIDGSRNRRVAPAFTELAATV